MSFGTSGKISRGRQAAIFFKESVLQRLVERKKGKTRTKNKTIGLKWFLKE